MNDEDWHGAAGHNNKNPKPTQNAKREHQIHGSLLFGNASPIPKNSQNIKCGYKVITISIVIGVQEKTRLHRLFHWIS